MLRDGEGSLRDLREDRTTSHCAHYNARVACARARCSREDSPRAEEEGVRQGPEEIRHCARGRERKAPRAPAEDEGGGRACRDVPLQHSRQGRNWGKMGVVTSSVAYN